MKKVFLFAALAVAAIALTGCNKTDPPAADPYTWTYTVVNDTDSEIVVSYNPDYYGYYGYGLTEVETFDIAPGESKIVIGYTMFGDYSKPVEVSDIYAEDDVIPFQGTKSAEITKHMWEEELKTKVMVGDREISHEVWLREYWSFEEKENYTYNYTLRVNDELVEELAVEGGSPLPQK